ncbi:MAG: hypothetical protein OEZ20_09190 [candidate division WOR-3 bacterium]|nr:hypothetical protein [candidate division WOR-3 bacterium]
MYRVQLKTLGLFLIFLIELSLADPIPGPILDVWDNLNGTAGEPLSPDDIYLVDEHKLRVAIHIDPISTTDFYNSNGTEISDSAFSYYRMNLPISFEYGIPGLFEIGFRMPYVLRNTARLRSNTGGWSDFSVRIRTRIYGDIDEPIYLALGGGIKFPTSQYEYVYYNLPLSYGSLDFFFGAYSMIRTGTLKYPIALTYSHTGRGREGDRIGEIITYRLGFVTDFGNFVDLNLGLKGYEITEENRTEVWPDLPAQGISKTSVEASLIIRTIENRVNFSAGLLYDLRGKRSYAASTPFFTMQVNF